MALRAFIRVVTIKNGHSANDLLGYFVGEKWVISLKNDRPANETLSMLKDAFALAENNETKQFVLTRAAEIRTIENVEWLAGFIDDPDLGETACASIAKLGHYRELREPNKEKFVPILQKVESTAKDKAVIEAAKKARLGM